MFIVFKRRSFSNLMNDTIEFFKTEGAVYFKNYFSICGVLIMLYLLCSYFLIDVIFNAIRESKYETSPVNSFIDNNIGLIIGLVIVSIILVTIISIISASYPVYFLKNIEEQPKEYQNKNLVLKTIKKDFGRLFSFGLGTLFLIGPLSLLLLSLSTLLVIFVIGIPLVLALFPTITSWISLSLYEYITNRKGFFESYKIGLNMLFSQFWIIIGNTLLFYVVMQIILGLITSIPQLLFYGNLFLSQKNNSDFSETQGFKLMFLAIFLLTSLVSFIANNVLLINQGLIYYSIRESKENKQSYADIDMIGTN
ncbi:hypothetical protein HX071_08140 [Myroides marinus]|uniref:Glycerophosphoryl diester phosphodiesterase membrane domain-containing protein n=2 Tax=Myroides marinus TaxID=703342 RepID=A0A163ZJE4_9FLAO|nr:hypothetical protein [Myroides marinus]KUF38277.1 hypothetical protein AS361_08525 [Myroides marinus]KZE81877.1 hypothetical protein AV926_00795 [Myroides marinus]MDM1362219.1 hypothetical protein [Myroides marinus]MDM1502174.1 hypothetical protein [Myroides marinus]